MSQTAHAQSLLFDAALSNLHLLEDVAVDNISISSYDSSKKKSANPLAKLKKKFEKIKSSSASQGSKYSIYNSQLNVESQGDSNISLSAAGSPVPSPTPSPLLMRRTQAYLPHQSSFQSTGTASSLAAESFSSSVEVLHDETTKSTQQELADDNHQADDTMTGEQAVAATAIMALAEDEDVEIKPGIYSLELSIISGTDLIARDSNGLSDPYIRVKQRKKMLHKTKIIHKTLNPQWEEEVKLSIPHTNFTAPVYFKVYDYDKFSGDDFMGQTTLNLNQLEKDRSVECDLKLAPKFPEDDDLPDQLGHITIRYKLTSEADSLIKSASPAPSVKHNSSQNNHIMNRIKGDDSLSASEWDYKVCIVLVEGRDLLSMDDNGFSDPFVRFKLQGFKHKSKTKSKTLNPHWMEAFQLPLSDKKSWVLDMSVYDNDLAGRSDFMGRTSLDLRTLEVDKTHDLTVHLEDEAGSLRLLITVTGAVSSTDHETSETRYAEIATRYGLVNSFKNFDDVGWLQLKTRDLTSMDLGGKSDPFCTVELVNTFLQTHTSYSTLNPEWNRVFTMPVNDIHSVLEITIYDEDKDMKKEFIGKIGIPLIQAESGVPKWYTLKNAKLTGCVKGAILVEINVCFNHFKAAIRTFNPRETKIVQEEPKLKIALLKRNVNRVRNIIHGIVAAKNFWESLIAWEKPSQTIIAFIAFLLAVWNFELYMLPLTLIILLLWNLIVLEIRGGRAETVSRLDADVGEEDIDEAEDEKETKMSFMAKLDSVRSTVCTVQEIIGRVADFGESIKNSMNWTIPWLSTLGVAVLCIITFILYCIPLRYIILLWGVNKFTKKLRKPNYISNNEVLDFLSRVPSDVEKVQYEVIQPDVDFDDVDDGSKSSNRVRRRRR